MSIRGVERRNEQAEIFFQVLGPLRVTRGVAMLDPGPIKQRRVLAALALKANQPVTRDEIIELVWHENVPASVTNLVHTYIARLRRTLEPGVAQRGSDRFIALTRTGYLLRTDEEHLDLLRFERLPRLARAELMRNNPHRAFELLHAATSLWRGDLAEDVQPAVGEHLIAPYLRQQYTSAVLELGNLAAKLGNHEQMLPILTRAVQGDPLHEGLCARMMTSLAGTGQQAAAIEVFKGIRARLKRELGLDPGAELQATFRSILRQERTELTTGGRTARG